MRLSGLFTIIVVFILGWSLHDVFNNINSEQPAKTVTGQVISTLQNERPSPSDIIKEQDIHVYNNKVIIDVDDPQWAKFTDTNSMDPVFDKGANAIQIVPTKAEQIQVGDIISFEAGFESGTIIHRVIEIEEDEDGWYARTKGDNNPVRDPGKVRFKQVKKMLVAIIY